MSERKLGKVVTFACRKGGVGKSANSYNLAGTLNAMGYRVLAIDLDGQCSLTDTELDGSGVIPEDGASVWALLEPNGEDPMLLITGSDNIDLLAGSEEADAAELTLAHNVVKASWSFQNAIDEYRKHYDYIIVDTPPLAGLLTRFGITVSDMVIIPVDLHKYGLKGAKKVVDAVDELARIKMRPERNVWLLPSRVESRERLPKLAKKELEKHPEMEGILLEFSIRKSAKIGETTTVGQPLVHYAPNDKGMEDYRKLADFVIEKA